MIFVTGIAAYAYPQSDTIKHIRNQYYDVVNKIKQSREKAYEGILYCNTLEFNKHGKAWRGVGNFNEKLEFWYSDDPNQKEKGNAVNVLKMVIVNGESAAYKYYKEFLFEKGEVIFVYFQFVNEGKANEYRYYLENQEVIKRITDTQEPMAEEAYTILREANMNRALFLKMFGL